MVVLAVISALTLSSSFFKAVSRHDIQPIVTECLATARLMVKDMHLLELNEAFASQAIANMRELDITLTKIDPNSGGIPYRVVSLQSSRSDVYVHRFSNPSG